jgi:hypothetical protein
MSPQSPPDRSADADAIAVTGDFDGWDPTAHPLDKQTGGRSDTRAPSHSAGVSMITQLRGAAPELLTR